MLDALSCFFSSIWDHLGSITGLIAVFIAAIALRYSIKETRENRKYQRLSARPHLDSFLDANRLVFEIKNTGLGPAIIKKVTWISDKKRYKNPETEEFEDYLKEINLGHTGMHISPLPKETWIGEGETRQILKFVENKDSETSENILASLKEGVVKIRGEIHYCDIYDNEFKEPIN